MKDQAAEIQGFISRLAQRASVHANFFGGWLPDDPGIRSWLRGQLHLTGKGHDEAWTGLLISAVPAGEGPEAESHWGHLAKRLGLSDTESVGLKGLFWRTRSLAALKVAVSEGARPATEDVQASPAARLRDVFVPHRAGALSFSMGPDARARSEVAFAERRSFDDDEDLLLRDLRRAGLRADGPSAVPEIGATLRSGHAGEWPLAVLLCPNPLEAAEQDFSDAVGTKWEEGWPAGAELCVLVTGRGFGMAYVSSARKFSEEERRWATAQLLAAFVQYRIREREANVLTSGSKGSAVSVDNSVTATGPVSLRAQFDLALYERWPHLALALRLAAPPSALRRLHLWEQLRVDTVALVGRELSLPLRVAEQRLKQF